MVRPHWVAQAVLSWVACPLGGPVEDEDEVIHGVGGMVIFAV